MSPVFTYGENRIILDEVRTKEGMARFVDELDLTPPFIVKPNWINEELAHLTDPVVLSWVLESLVTKGETVVTEAYSARNQTMRLRKREGETKLERHRRAERVFLRRQGLERTFRELGVDYVNVDEELAAGRMVDAETVGAETEARYAPVERSELYSHIPERLYQLRAGTFISLAKFKLTFSMCVKNIFGLIPDTADEIGRGSYHGKKDRKLPRNIIDINKIYRSLFTVVGMVEGIRSLTGLINRGGHHSMFGYDYEVFENRGLFYFGSDPLWLDAFIAAQCGIDPRSYRTAVLPEPHLSLGFEELSQWPKALEEDAEGLGKPF